MRSRLALREPLMPIAATSAFLALRPIPPIAMVSIDAPPSSPVRRSHADERSGLRIHHSLRISAQVPGIQPRRFERLIERPFAHMLLIKPAACGIGLYSTGKSGSRQTPRAASGRSGSGTTPSTHPSKGARIDIGQSERVD